MKSRLAKGIVASSLLLASPAMAETPGSAGKPPEGAGRVVYDLYEAFEKGDIAAVEKLIAPDATWTYHGPASKLPFGGTRHGPKGVADFFAKVEQTLENPIPTQRAYLVAGDMVAVPGTEESTVRSTGIRYRADLIHLFRIRDGKIVSFEEFIDSGKVLLAFQGDKSAGIDAEPTAAAAPGDAPQAPAGENKVGKK